MKKLTRNDLELEVPYSYCRNGYRQANDSDVYFIQEFRASIKHSDDLLLRREGDAFSQAFTYNSLGFIRDFVKTPNTEYKVTSRVFVGLTQLLSNPGFDISEIHDLLVELEI